MGGQEVDIGRRKGEPRTAGIRGKRLIYAVLLLYKALLTLCDVCRYDENRSLR